MCGSHFMPSHECLDVVILDEFGGIQVACCSGCGQMYNKGHEKRKVEKYGDDEW
jgi:hypothetical protein